MDDNYNDDFDVNDWLDDLERLEAAKDMHLSIYYDPEHEDYPD